MQKKIPARGQGGALPATHTNPPNDDPFQIYDDVVRVMDNRPEFRADGKPIRYFAVPDPLRPGKMSYWHLENGDIAAWPPGESRWADLQVDEERVRAAIETVGAAIDADGLGAAIKFAWDHCRCFCCAEPLPNGHAAVLEHVARIHSVAADEASLACPGGLDDLGRRAHETIVRVIRERRPDFSLGGGGTPTFYAPEQYARIDPRVEAGYVLAVVFDGGDLRPFFEVGDDDELAEAMQSALEAIGLFAEQNRVVDALIWPLPENRHAPRGVA